MTRYGREDIWDASTWAEIDKAVAEEAARVRVGRRVFATESVSAADGGPASWVSTASAKRGTFGLYAPEGDARPFGEIAVPFCLSQTQAEAEPRHHLGRTLARSAAKTVSVAEDLLLFGGDDAAARLKTMTDNDEVKIANKDQFEDRGIAPEAGESLGPRSLAPGKLADAASTAISRLTAKGWPEPYVLILGEDLQVNAHKRINTSQSETPADRLRPRLKHLLGSQALGAKEGVLISLAGGTTTIYGPTEPTTTFLGQDMAADGTYYVFRVVERFQFAVREPDAIVLLKGS